MDTLRLVVAVFAVYRLSRMIAVERGPFSLCERLRGLVFRRFGKDSWLTDGISCTLCVSFWVGIVVAWLLPWVSLTDLVLTGLALSGGASFLFKQERGDAQAIRLREEYPSMDVHPDARGMEYHRPDPFGEWVRWK